LAPGKIAEDVWHEYRITARGNQLVHNMDGQLVSELVDNQVDKAATSGVIAFQLHAGAPMVIQFKDIQLKELK
jgi:Domain of Unknown Function (DUF1080)